MNLGLVLLVGIILAAIVGAAVVCIASGLIVEGLIYSVVFIFIVALFIRKRLKKLQEKRKQEKEDEKKHELWRLHSAQNVRFAEIELAVKQFLCSLCGINGTRLEVELNAIFTGNDQLRYGSYFGGYEKEDWFVRKEKLDTVIDLLAERFQKKRGTNEFTNVWYCPHCGSMNFEKDSQCCVCLNNRNGSHNV